MKKHILVLTTFLIVSLSNLHGQEATVASGGAASGNGGSASYSIGQVVYTTIAGTGISVSNGVQQPFEISTLTGITEENIRLGMSAYPNPTIDRLILEIEAEYQDLSFQLYDLNGKLLENSKIVQRVTTIEMNGYKPSVYFVKVVSQNKLVKSFKIIKN